MDPRSPASFTWITYLWVFVLSAWGGVLRLWKRIQKGEARVTDLTQWVGEISMSAFVGVITFYLAQAAGLSSLLTAALVAISGHMGARALTTLEEVLKRRAEGQ